MSFASSTIASRLLSLVTVLLVGLCQSCGTESESAVFDSEAIYSRITRCDIESVARSAPAFTALTLANPLTFLWEMLPLGDSVLILNQLYQSDSNLLVHRIGAPQGSDYHLVGQGEGPNSVSTITNLRSSADSLYFFDPNMRTMHRMALGAGQAVQTVATVGALCQQAITWEGSVYCLPVDIGEVADSRFARYSLEGTLDSAFGGFPPRHQPMTGKVRYGPAGNNQAYQADARLSSDGEYLVLTYLSKDRLEIYGPGGRLLHATDGPDGFDPDFAATEGDASGAGLSPLTDVTRIGYISVAVNAAGVYALYSGGLTNPSAPAPGYRSFATTDLLVFDWNGALRKSYTLPYAAHELAVTEGGTVYIASDDEDVQIYRSMYPL